MVDSGRSDRGGGRGWRLSSVWVCAALSIASAISLMSLLSTADLAYGVRAGQVMLDTWVIPRVDTMTFTAYCAPWLDQQWGVQAVMGATFDGLGWFGLALLRAALAAGVVGFAYAACRANGAERTAAAWLSILAWIPGLGGQLRAQSFGLVLFAAILWLVTSREARPRRLAWAIPLLALWANTHGSFPLGLFVLVMAVIEDRVHGRSGRRTLVVTALSALATTITPFGPRVWAYIADLSTDPVIRDVVREWQPTWTSIPVGILFFATAALAVVAFVRHRRELTWPAWVQLGVFFVLGLTQMRALHWWTIVLAVTLAGLPWARRARPEPRKRVNLALAGAFALLPLVAVARWLPHGGTDPPAHLLRLAPERLTEELRSILRPGEPFANPQAWGSWFELALPSHPVYVDSRIEVVPDEVFRTALRIQNVHAGWEDDLDAIPVRVLVVDRRTQAALVDAIGSSPEWREVYADEEGLVLVREGRAPPAELPPCPEAPG